VSKRYSSVLACVWDMPTNLRFKLKLTYVILLKKIRRRLTDEG